MKFHIITLFPEMFSGVFDHSIIKRGRERGAVEINLINLRDFAVDKHGTVDDKPYGGGTGMLLMPKPIFEAVRSIRGNEGDSSRRVIILTPRGQKLTQGKVRELSGLGEIILICGRYEGVDERVHEHLADEEISIGNYVLSGGEIPTMVVVDAIVRLLPGVLEKNEATLFESFSEGLLEHPQYTRPENFEGMKVPEVLLSGNHGKIKEWKVRQAKKLTKERRPDLLKEGL